MAIRDSPDSKQSTTVRQIIMAAFVHHRVIEFHETDAAGLVHFSNYFRYAEAAEHALFRSINYSMMLQEGMVFYGWPRVRAKAKYSAPLHSGDSIRIELEVLEVKVKAIEFGFRILRESDGLMAAKGSFATMHVRINGETREMTSKDIPDALVQALMAYKS